MTPKRWGIESNSIYVHSFLWLFFPWGGLREQ